MASSAFMTGSLVALGLFWCSVVGLRFAHGLTYMFRKVLHSTIQAAGVALVYAVALPSAFAADPVVRCAAAVVALGIMPAVLLTRGPLKRHHNVVGTVGLLAYAALVCALAVFHTGSHRAASSALLALHVLYAAAAAVWARPTTSRVVVRGPDGAYTVRHGRESVIVVGGGWSAYLNRAVLGAELSARDMAGEYATNTWGAGTPIAAVQAALRVRGQTLPSHPCIMGATLGGWVFTEAHGSGGTATGASIRSVTLYDCLSRTVTKHRYPCEHVLSPDGAIGGPQRRLVLEVEVAPVDNARCHLRVADVRRREDVHAFMYEDSVNRMIFFDRSAAVSLIWSTSRAAAPQTRGVGSLVPVWLLSIGPRFFSRVRRSDWNRTATLSDANHFAPDPPYYSGLIARLFTNFELYVRPVPTSEALWGLVTALQRLFADRHPRARCEVRIEQHTLFLDFSVVGTSDATGIEALVRGSLRPRSLLYHRGKFVPAAP